MRRKCGFTLAEVLITLSVIGIVSALTIPELVKNMNNYAFGKAKQVTLAKITEATNEMKSNDVLSGYTSNAAFANEFQKYMKIAKRCDSSELVKCFAPKFTSSDGVEYVTTTLTTGTTLSSKNLNDNTVALMLANGTSVLLSLRDATKVGADCDRIDPVNNTSNTTSCLSFLYDINGYGGPNVLGKDIGTVNVTKLVCSGLRTADGTCFAGAIIPTAITYTDCMTKKGALGINACASTNDFWAGAVAHCGNINNMPTQAQLDVLANTLYNVSNCGTSACTGSLDYGKATQAGLPATGTFWIWSSEEDTGTDGNNAFRRNFPIGSSNRYSSNRANGSTSVICLGD